MIAMLIGPGIVALAALGAIMRPLIFASLQPELAEAKGERCALFRPLFWPSSRSRFSECAQVVGIPLVFSLIVGPPAAAQLVVKGLRNGMALSAGLALADAWLGIAIAYYTDWLVSFCIVVLSALGYFAAPGSGYPATQCEITFSGP